CHTRFGETNALHSALDEKGYRIDHMVEGDSVTEVLGYVQYSKQNLMQRMRQANEEALRRGLLTFEESALLVRRYEEGLAGYTYLEEEEPAHELANGLARHGGFHQTLRDEVRIPPIRRGRVRVVGHGEPEVTDRLLPGKTRDVFAASQQLDHHE